MTYNPKTLSYEVKPPCLTDENKTKVRIIADIAKAWKLWKDKDISVKAFDILYDHDAQTLNRILFNLCNGVGRTQPPPTESFYPELD